jgi:hypothetical protein
MVEEEKKEVGYNGCERGGVGHQRTSCLFMSREELDTPALMSAKELMGVWKKRRRGLRRRGRVREEEKDTKKVEKEEMVAGEEEEAYS